MLRLAGNGAAGIIGGWTRDGLTAPRLKYLRYRPEGVSHNLLLSTNGRGLFATVVQPLDVIYEVCMLARIIAGDVRGVTRQFGEVDQSKA